MNFTNLKAFLSNRIEGLILIFGFLIIDLAITLLTNYHYGLLALGIELVMIAFISNSERGG